MAGYKNTFIKYLSFLSSTLPTNILIKISKQNLIVPVYHLVSDVKVPHIEHLYAFKNTNQFKKDIDFLLKNYNPISYSDFQESIISGVKPKKNSFLLTFDDGLREFNDVIAPILFEKGIPAINFLNSDFVDNKDLFFRYKVSLLIEEISKNEQILHEENVKIWFYQFSKDLNYKKILKEINYKNKDSLDKLASILDLNFEKYLETNQPYLTSTQIFDLQKKGFYFGAHSVNHPEYRFLDLENQIQQTKECLDFLEKNKLSTHNIFAFPFTDYEVSKDFFKSILENDKIVDLSFGSAGIKKDYSPLHVHRIPFEVGEKKTKEIINSEYLYFLIKEILGKNLIKRN